MVRVTPSASGRRRRVVRHIKQRCRSCGIREATRYCPGVTNYICPACCEKMRPGLSACSSCRYYVNTLARSREIPEPDPKFYSALVSDSEKAGLLSLALAFVMTNGKLKAMFFLLDFWKSGMKKCFVDVNLSKEEFDRKCVNMGDRASKKIDINEAKRLIKRGLYISNAAGTPIPEDYIRWKYMLGDMSNIPDPSGSLYKCSRCSAELTQPIVDTIKKHSQSEDVHFYIVCGKCAGEFED